MFGENSIGMRIVDRIYNARLAGKNIWWFPKIGEISGFVYGFSINLILYLTALVLAGFLVFKIAG